jgi:hypothetical protein
MRDGIFLLERQIGATSKIPNRATGINRLISEVNAF